MDDGRPPDSELDASPKLAGIGAEPGEPEDPGEPVHLADVESIEPRPPRRGFVAIVGLLVVALVVFAIVGGRIATAEPRATAPHALELAVIDAGGELHTIDAKGLSIADFKVPAVKFGLPAWSPDGSRIAVIGQNGDAIRIYVVDAGDAASKPTVIYDGPDHPPFYLYWSPDGRRVAFLTTE